MIFVFINFAHALRPPTRKQYSVVHAIEMSTRSTKKRAKNSGGSGGSQKRQKKANDPKPLVFNDTVAPFWNKITSQKWSDALWQCDADVVNKASQPCESASSKRLARAPAWHSANCQTVPSTRPSEPLTTPLHEIISTDAATRLISTEDTASAGTTKVRRFRIYPTEDQKRTLNRYFGAAAWTYNELVDLGVRRGGFGKFALTRYLVRRQAVNKPALTCKGKLEIMESCPYDIRDEAANDYVKAVATSIALKKAGRNGKTPSTFRKRKDPQQSIVILKKHWGKTRGPFGTRSSGVRGRFHAL